jgi:hypothetical protein
VEALGNFERDLLDCGVPLGDVRMLLSRYRRALGSGSHFDWIELYVGMFATLLQRAHRTRPADPSAAQRALLLVNDDLGSSLFDDSARLHLAAALSHAAA